MLSPQEYPGLEPGPALIVGLGDEEETKELGRLIAEHLGPGDFLGLIGNLGAGKTSLMKGLVSFFATESIVSSPTYSLIQHYETSPPVVHMDLYRLHGWEELESIGYWDVLDGQDQVVCVEWLDRVSGAWPGEGMIVELERADDGRRARVWFSEGFGEAKARLVQDVRASRLREGDEHKG